MRRKKTQLLIPATLLGLLSSVTIGGESTPMAVDRPTASDEVAPTGDETTIPWNRRTVEHLYNRAGFGARGGMIARALERTPEEVVDELMRGGRGPEPPHYSQGTVQDTKAGNNLPRSEKRRVKALASREDRLQMETYASWWVDRMVSHEDPLRDRMTLFWHGLFATQHEMVKRSFDMIQQHQMIRANALGSYRTLLHGIAKDPAMLLFLDNQKNKKGNPNENLARELMELFSLGEGNYTEQDVKEVARALTGTSRDKIGNFKFIEKEHDKGSKTILGETGRFGTEEVCEILLRQTACARYIAGRIITYLEGVKPDELRLVEYAAFLQRKDYQLRPFLRKLLLDERFYREEVMEARILGPIDYMVGSIRRLGIKVDSRFILASSRELGQKLFDPPSVKGWDGGEAWINTGSLLARGNTVGLMIGTIDLNETFRRKKDKRSALDRPARDEREPEEDTTGMDPDTDDESEMDEEGFDEEMEMGGMMGDVAMEEEEPVKDNLPKELGRLVNALGSDYHPTLNLTFRFQRNEVVGDNRIVSRMLDDLLAIEAPADTQARMLKHFKTAREEAGLSEENFLDDPDRAEVVLRSLAHLILSLPEAQLG